MNGRMLWVLRVLALCHFVWGGLLLVVAGWSTLSVLRVLPYMSTGTFWTNLPGVMLWSAMSALPLAAFAVWMAKLGRSLWSPGTRMRITLLWTHSILLVLGAMAVYIGIHSVAAAELSSVRGGGLLGPIAYIPLLFGLPVVVLAVCSLAIALLALPLYRTGEDRKSK